MPSFTFFAASFAVALAAFVGYLYLVGIPRETKRRMENAALNAMGENKSSYLVKDALGRIPDSDQKDLKDVKKGVSDTAGFAMQNPLGKEAGQTADDVSAPLTGR